MKAITLLLGGIPILIHSENSEIVNLAQEAFRGFIVFKHNKRSIIRVRVIVDKEIKDVNPYIYGNPHRAGVLKESTKIFSRASTYKGMFDFKELKAEVRQGLSAAPLYLFLRFILSVYLPVVGGFFLHSTSVIKGNKCFLFSGKPQSGKSSIAKLSSGYHVLSDDFSIVRKYGNSFYAFSSPFWGHVEAKGENMKRRRGCVGVGALYFLKQDDEVYVRRLSKKEAALRLIKNIAFLAKDGGLYKKIICLADEITDKVLAYSLHFKLDSTFWRWIK